MRRLEISSRALRDIADISKFSRVHHGPAAAARYDALIRAGLKRLLRQPDGTRGMGGVLEAVRLLHLKDVRHLVPEPDRVRQPRHYLAYVFDDERVRVVALLHDRMDLRRRLRGRRPFFR